MTTCPPSSSTRPPRSLHSRRGERAVLRHAGGHLHDGRPPATALALSRQLIMPFAYAAEGIARMTGREPFVTKDRLRIAQYRMFFNAAKAERELGFRARPYREGLADAIEWFYKAGLLQMVAEPRLGPAAHPRTARMPSKAGATMTVSGEAFVSQLTAVAAEIESLIDRLLAAPAIEGKRARPQRLLDAMRYASLNGGKRFRPFLVVAIAALFDVPRKRALMVGAALECVHCYSLVHDDLPAMDDDDLRRGHPTAHKAFDEATAILAGDGLLTFAFDILARPDAHPDPAVRIELLLALARVGARRHGGRADARPGRRRPLCRRPAAGVRRGCGDDAAGDEDRRAAALRLHRRWYSGASDRRRARGPRTLRLRCRPSLPDRRRPPRHPRRQHYPGEGHWQGRQSRKGDAGWGSRVRTGEGAAQGPGRRGRGGARAVRRRGVGTDGGGKVRGGAESLRPQASHHAVCSKYRSEAHCALKLDDSFS